MQAFQTVAISAVVAMGLSACNQYHNPIAGADGIRLKPGQNISVQESSAKVILSGSIAESNGSLRNVQGANVYVILNAGSNYEKQVASTVTDSSGSFEIVCKLPCEGYAKNFASKEMFIGVSHHLEPFTVRIVKNEYELLEKRIAGIGVQRKSHIPDTLNIGVLHIVKVRTTD